MNRELLSRAKGLRLSEQQVHSEEKRENARSRAMLCYDGFINTVEPFASWNQRALTQTRSLAGSGLSNCVRIVSLDRNFSTSGNSSISLGNSTLLGSRAYNSTLH